MHQFGEFLLRRRVGTLDAAAAQQGSADRLEEAMCDAGEFNEYLAGVLISAVRTRGAREVAHEIQRYWPAVIVKWCIVVCGSILLERGMVLHRIEEVIESLNLLGFVQSPGASVPPLERTLDLPAVQAG